MELRNAVTAAFGINLPATVTFDYPTVAALAAFIASRLGPEDAGAASGTRYDLPGGVGRWAGGLEGGCARQTSWQCRSATLALRLEVRFSADIWNMN